MAEISNGTDVRDEGHIGYPVRPSERGKGHGKRMLAELVNEARNGAAPPKRHGFAGSGADAPVYMVLTNKNL